MAAKKAIPAATKTPAIKKSGGKKTAVNTEVKTAAATPARKTASHLSAEFFDIKGNVSGTVDLPQEIFGAKVNKVLMSQAVRVYLANQRQGNASTKTRGEVQGSTRKIYRQKGTGRARHGGLRAPIFVHGGIAHGPKPADHTLKLSKKMKKAALFSALTAQFNEGHVKFIDGVETIEPRTKLMADVFKSLALSDKKRKVLLVATGHENVIKSARNLEGITVTPATQLTTYTVLNNKTVVFEKSAIELLKTHFLKA